MTATPREIVQRTLDFAGPPRAARDCWILPVARAAHPGEPEAIVRDFPPDIVGLNGHERAAPLTRGDQFGVGEFVDEWGCTFLNIHPGVIGEVKDPLVSDWESDRGRIRFPRGWLTVDRDSVNRACAATDCFTACPVWVRPFERLQFLRGSENLYLDLADPPPGLFAFIGELHAFYCELLTTWARTDVDSLRIMDDWGAQRSLLVAPDLWRAIFRPLYRDYVQIAHAHGKRVFMHSDGNILAILPDLVEIGVDALNSQIFCMGVENLRPFAGRMTFWGEIDRQHLLAAARADEVESAVCDVHANLWRSGGCIAQCEFGPGARPENVRRVYETWARLVS